LLSTLTAVGGAAGALVACKVFGSSIVFGGVVGGAGSAYIVLRNAEGESRIGDGLRAAGREVRMQKNCNKKLHTPKRLVKH